MRVALDSTGTRSYVLATVIATVVMLLPVCTVSAQGPPTAADIQQLIDAEKYAEAEEALAAAPESKEIGLLRAELYRVTDRDDEAYEEYQRIAAEDPTSVTAQFWLATIDRWKRRYEDALAGYGKVLALSECNRDSLKGRARVYESLDRDAEAEADLRAALECNSEDAEATRLLADLLLAQGDYDEAAELLGQVFSGADLELRLGELELSRGDDYAARDHFRTALELSPGDADLLGKLADIERELGNHVAALSLYEEGAAIADDGGELYWIGNLSWRLGDHDRAEAAFEELLTRKPGDSGALIGMARLRRSQGRTRDAIVYVDEVLENNPTHGEALVLRGSLKRSLGYRNEARSDFRAALARKSDDVDARLLLDRMGPAHFFTISDRSSRSRLIEGLEDEGVIDDGVPIKPTRIEYIGDTTELYVESETGQRSLFVGLVSRGRDATRNLDRQAMIYDFDVRTALVGFDVPLSDQWRWSWRVGGTKYEPRTDDAIESTTSFRGSVELAYSGPADDFVISYGRRPFIQRGFAADTDFTIFNEDRVTLSWIRDLGRDISLRFRSDALQLDPRGSDSPVSGSLTLRWARGGNAVFLSAVHDPFPSRSLNDDGTLTFIDYDGVRFGVRAATEVGFRFSGDGTYGRYGETIRDIVVDGESVEGPLERNTGRTAILELAWSPPEFLPFSIGVGYDRTDYDFRTSPYNTRSSDVSSAFIQFADDTQIRARYEFRAAYRAVDDDRVDDTYYGFDYFGRLEIRLGDYPREKGSYWIGAEGSYKENDLDEEGYKYRVYLTVPF